jgi:fructokinase
METKRTQPLVLGVGEVLWDLLPGGKQLGGAPANFAYHARALGADALTVSRVGVDALGQEALGRIRALGLRDDGITADASAPTGTVTVALDDLGKPTFTVHEHVAWDFLAANEEVLQEASRADVVCFGTLAQRSPVSRSTIRQLLTAAPARALRIFDINLRQRFWSHEIILASLEAADVLKLNDEELPVVAELLGLTGGEENQVRELAARFELTAVALTRGAQGSSLLVGREWVSRPGSKLTIADTVGAGDSYTAALALGLLAGQNPERILRCAHRVADYVCTQPGATPPLPADLLAECVPLLSLPASGASPRG